MKIQLKLVLCIVWFIVSAGMIGVALDCHLGFGVAFASVASLYTSIVVGCVIACTSNEE